MTYFTQTGSAACVTDLLLCTLAVTVTAWRTVWEGVEASQTVVTLTAPYIVLTPTTQQVRNSYLAPSVIPTCDICPVYSTVTYVHCPVVWSQFMSWFRTPSALHLQSCKTHSL